MDSSVWVPAVSAVATGVPLAVAFLQSLKAPIERAVSAIERGSAAIEDIAKDSARLREDVRVVRMIVESERDSRILDTMIDGADNEPTDEKRQVRRALADRR